jgi:hypothetical protein
MTTHQCIPCPACHIALNLPESAAGKKLKCPKCGAKFKATPDDGRSPSSTFLLQSFEPTPAQTKITQPPVQGAHPTASGVNRETFDLPLLNEVAAGSKSPSSSAHAGDAQALFREDRESAPRRPNAAEARSKARRCPTCGGVVPAGMSVCSTCGFDLETGTRVELDDDLMPEAPPRPSIPPLDVSVMGGACLLASLILALAAVIRGSGWEYFFPVCAFAVFGSVQFLRGRTARFLLTALTIGAVIDIVALVAMPIVEANMEPTIIQRTVVDQPEAADLAIGSVADRLDTHRLRWGLTLLLFYPGAAIYLVSPAARRHCGRRSPA